MKQLKFRLPFFNREVDREIIRNMTKLEKVYFQAPNPQDIKETFYSIREDIPDDKMVLRSNCDQFLIPIEL